MKLRPAFLPTLFALLLGSTALVAQTAPAPAPAAAKSDEEPETELAEKMSDIGRAFKKLRAQVGDPAKNESSLKLVATLIENATASAKLEPEKLADIPAAEQPKFKADYEAKMKSFIAQIAKLEAALKAGNNEEAKKIVAELGETQKDAHKQFRKKKPEKK